MKIAITGSAGFIGSLLYENLKKDGLEVVGIDLQKPRLQGGPLIKASELQKDEFIDLACDLSNSKEVSSNLFRGCTHVIHLAAQGDPDAPMLGNGGVLNSNMAATYNVLEACKAAEVKKLIFASSNHVTHGYFMGTGGPGSIRSNYYGNNVQKITLKSAFNPDSLYAVSKIFGEEICKYYAIVEKAFSVICLRIGWCLYDDPTVLKNTQYEDYLRSMWLSRKDCIGYFRSCLSKEMNKGEFVLAYALSNNGRSTIELSESYRITGYTAQDNSEDYFDS